MTSRTTPQAPRENPKTSSGAGFAPRFCFFFFFGGGRALSGTWTTFHQLLRGTRVPHVSGAQHLEFVGFAGSEVAQAQGQHVEAVDP